MIDMDADPLQIVSLTSLLRAELLAQLVPATTIQERYRLNARFRPCIAERCGILAKALALASPAVREPAVSASVAAPILLVCESQPFEPDLASLHDQVLLRLLTSLEATGMEGWVLRLRARLRPLRQRLRQLPARPSAIIALGVVDEACLGLLQELAPVVRLGVRSTPMRRIACVEYDAQMEAYAIASYAAAHKMEQIAFVGPIGKTAGRRSIADNDVAVLNALTRQAHGWNVAVPSHLTFWIDASQNLRFAQILPKIAEHLASRVLAVVSGPAWALALAQTAGAGASHIICRHWSAERASGLPVIGPDLEQLVRILLARALNQDGLPTEAAVLVPPTWHRQ
jgi:hypothetical protein